MNGSFSKIILTKDKVFKIENVVDSYSQNILNSIDGNHKKYYKDLKRIGIDVAKLYFDKKIFGKNIEIQKRIYGKSLSEYMEDKNIPVDNKIEKLKKLLIIYKKTLDEDVALDLNMQNFIISGDKLVYIDLIPSIYKSKIPKENIENDEYKNYYLNNNLAIANLVNYFLRSLLYVSKDELKRILNVINVIVKELFDLELDISKNKKANLLGKYIYSDMNYEEYEETYQKIKRM